MTNVKLSIQFLIINCKLTTLWLFGITDFDNGAYAKILWPA
jgi:hypothetical protein